MLKSLFHWKVLVNILVALGIFTALVWGTFRWLEYRTNHGKEIPVPNVMNRSVHDAIKILEDSGLEAEVDSFKYDPKYRPFQVLQIYPSAGSRVKDGRTIILKVNPRTWAKVSVPDVLDRYKYLAFRQLDLVGLKVGDTIFEPNIQKDAVIRMQLNGTTLKPGTLLPKFSVIDLVIGTGPLRNVAIPNLVGMTVAQAKEVIRLSHFEVGIVENEDGSKDETAIVYYQDPDSGTLRDQGMQIDLWASKKSPAQMYNKIQELNKIYRINLAPPPSEPMDYGDTYTPPPTNSRPRTDDGSSRPRPAPEPTTPVERNPEVIESTPKPVDKPKPTTAPAQTKPKATAPVEEKPKVKKVIE